MAPNDPARPFTSANLDSSAGATVNDRLGKHGSAMTGAQKHTLNVAADPNYVKNPEAFGHYGLEAIVAKAQSLKPGNVHAAAGKWEVLAGTTAGFAEGLVGSKLDANWTGKTANAAASASTSFFRALADVDRAVLVVSQRAHAAAFATDALSLALSSITTKATVQAVIPTIVSGQGTALQQTKLEEMRRELTAALDRIVPSSLYPTGIGVPGLAPPPQLGDAGPDKSGPQHGGPVSALTGGQRYQGPQPGGNNPAAPGPQQVTDAGAPETATAANQAAQQHYPSGQPAPPGVPGGTSPTRSEPAPYTPGGNHFGPGLGAGGISGRDGGSGRATGPGGPAMAAGAGLGGSRSGAARLPAGMPGMPAARRKSDGEEEREHKTPDWLVNAENGEAQFGTPKGVATPPVLGVWEEPSADELTVNNMDSLLPQRPAERSQGG